MIDMLMDIAAKELRERLPEGWDVDDVMWNDRCFQFVIIKGFRAKPTDPYRFTYDPDEELWGTAEEQLYRWLDYYFGKEV